jgi:hypothetical protein
MAGRRSSIATEAARSSSACQVGPAGTSPSIVLTMRASVASAALYQRSISNARASARIVSVGLGGRGAGQRGDPRRESPEHAAVVRELRGESLADGIRHVGG